MCHITYPPQINYIRLAAAMADIVIFFEASRFEWKSFQGPQNPPFQRRWIIKYGCTSMVLY